MRGVMSKKRVVKRTKRPTFRYEEADYFRLVYGHHIYGGLTPQEGRIIFYVDRLKPGGNTPDFPLKEIVREAQVEVHMPPTAFKALAEWATRHVERIEKELGRPIEAAAKTKRKKGQPSYYA